MCSNRMANKIKRIVRSSLEAECLALVEGLKEATFVRDVVEEVFGKYPPPKNFGNVFKCTFCDNNNPQEFDGNGKKQRYIRHVGAVHRKVLDFISPEDFKSPQNAPETPQSAKEIR